MAWVTGSHPGSEIIAVDDGSTDGSAMVLDRLGGEFPSLRVVRHAINQGYGAAIRTGCDAATGDIIAYMDADGQFDPADLDLLLPCLRDFEFVAGWRRIRADPTVRRVSGALYRLLMRWALGVKARDVNCGLKVFRRSVWPDIRPVHGSGALFSAELLNRVERRGVAWTERPVPHHPRMSGQSTGLRPRVAGRMVLELVRLKRSNLAPPSVCASENRPDGGAPAVSGAGLIALVAGIFVLLILRRPDAVTNPQFFADDGEVFFRDQLVLGFGGSALRPYGGYLQIGARAIAALASVAPLRFVPLGYFALDVVVATAACAWLARREFEALLPGRYRRAVFCLWLACCPVGLEIVGPVVNVRWYLLWLGYLLAVSPPRQGRKRFASVLAWWAIGLSDPGCVAFLPIWLARAARAPDRKGRLVSISCAAPLLVQLAVIGVTRMSGGGSVRHEATGIAVGLGRLVSRAPQQAGVFAAALVATASLIVPIVLFYRQADGRARGWLRITGVFFVVFLAVTFLGRPDLLYYPGLISGGGRARYLFVPFAICALALTAAAIRGSRLVRLAALPAGLLIGAATVASYRLPPFADLDWPGRARGLEKSMDDRWTGPVEIPLNPPGWRIRIRLIDGRPERDDDIQETFPPGSPR